MHSPEAATAKICLQEVDHNIKRIAGGIHIDLVGDEFPYRTAVHLKISLSCTLKCLVQISLTRFSRRTFLNNFFGKKDAFIKGVNYISDSNTCGFMRLSKHEKLWRHMVLYLGLIDEEYPEDQSNHQTSDEHFEDKED